MKLSYLSTLTADDEAGPKSFKALDRFRSTVAQSIDEIERTARDKADKPVFRG
jgi:hypothetical protein